ncbi:MAG: BatA domain-containing protein [Brevundimonas sp.]
MTPALLLPGALAALAALLIPLVIHIARRTETRTVDFAALRWLGARSRPRRRPRIDERWLLAARLALLTALAVWLAQPVLWGVEDRRPVIAVAPGLDAASIVGDAGGDSRLIRLAAGFPSLDERATATSAPLVSLIRQLDAELPPETPLQVVVPAVLNGVDAERPRLSRRIEWRVVTTAPPSPPTEPLPPPPALVVRHAVGTQAGVRFFRAAATAWTAPGLAPSFEAAAADRPLEARARYLVWLAPGALPEPVVSWIKSGGVALLSRETRSPADGPLGVVWRDPVGEPLAVAARLGKGRVLHLTRPLEPAANPQLLEPDFPEVLLAMLVPPPAPARVAAADHAPLPGGSAYDQPPLDLRPWLTLLILVLFGVERWLATRRRAAAP